MSYAVRKYIYNGHRPICGVCKRYLPMDEWFFQREKYRNGSIQNHKWLQSAKNYKCIACLFDVPAYIAERVNTAYNMRETLVDDEEKFLKYPEARKIALAAKGLK